MQGGSERSQLSGQESRTNDGLSTLGSTLVLPWQSWTVPGSSQNLSNAFPPAFKDEGSFVVSLPTKQRPHLWSLPKKPCLT